jgi:PBSX family phage terminase large subunit
MIQRVEIVKKVHDELITNCTSKHRIIYGGRGKGASWSIARILLLEGMTEKLFIVCVREVQKSIELSVQKLLVDTIKHFGWQYFYKVTKNKIVGTNGTVFVFSGLREHNSDSIKSLEGADRCWVAEAQSISRQSIDTLRPTLRKKTAIFWWDFNPRYSSDPVWVDYIRNKDKSAKTLFLMYPDNKWFSETSMPEEMEADYLRDEARARHIWEGELSDANDSFVCPAELVEVAQTKTIRRPSPKVPIVGADIAHQGGDEITFYKRIDNKIVDWMISTYQDAVTTTQKLKDFAGKNSYINIDNGHLGCAVADFLEADQYSVSRINFGGTPKDKEHYEDVATEMYFELRDQLEFIDIPDDEELAIQLYTRKYKYINGKRGYEVMKIESKDEFAEHTHALHKSPDRSDGVVLCYYDPIGTMDVSAIAGSITAYGGR